MTTQPATMRHLAASMVVLDVAEAKVLLVRHKASGMLQFPGGHVDPGESPGEAALREVLEETGVHTAICHQRDGVDVPGMRRLETPWLTFEIPAPAKPDRGPGKPAEPAHHHVDLLFIGTADASAGLASTDDGVSGAMWASISTLHELGSLRDDVAVLTREALTVLGQPQPAGGPGHYDAGELRAEFVAHLRIVAIQCTEEAGVKTPAQAMRTFVASLLSNLEGTGGTFPHLLACKQHPNDDLVEHGLRNLWLGYGDIAAKPASVREFMWALSEETELASAATSDARAALFEFAHEICKIISERYVLVPVVPSVDDEDVWVPSQLNIAPGLGEAMRAELFGPQAAHAKPVSAGHAQP